MVNARGKADPPVAAPSMTSCMQPQDTHPGRHKRAGRDVIGHVLLAAVRVVRVPEREQVLGRAGRSVRVGLFFRGSIEDASRDSRTSARRLERRQTGALVVVPASGFWNSAMYFSVMMSVSVGLRDRRLAVARAHDVERRRRPTRLSFVWNAASAMINCVSSYVMIGWRNVGSFVRRAEDRARSIRRGRPRRDVVPAIRAVRILRRSRSASAWIVLRVHDVHEGRAGDEILAERRVLELRPHVALRRADECAVFQSFAGELMPLLASASALVYCALPSFSTWWR